MNNQSKPKSEQRTSEYKEIAEELHELLKNFIKVHGAAFDRMTEAAVKSLRDGHKILVFGNGGSAAQAQHFAAELVNRFLRERPPIRAIALTTDSSALTSIANDASFDLVFSRQVEALGDRGDVAIALSTSGNSPNVIEALKKARGKGLVTVAFTGKGGGNLASLPDFLLAVPSSSTPRIQEAHLFLLHALAQEIEERLA